MFSSLRRIPYCQRMCVCVRVCVCSMISTDIHSFFFTGLFVTVQRPNMINTAPGVIGLLHCSGFF